MSESAYYDSLGIPPGGLGSRRRAYFGGTPTDKLSDADLAFAYYSAKMPEVEGTLDDLRFAYLRSLGGTGSINDMLSQLYNGDITEEEEPVDPPEEGLAARFSFNDPGNEETFDSVANRRMTLSSFEKVTGYSGQGLRAISGTMGLGVTPEGILNREHFSFAQRLLIPAIDATTQGIGLRFKDAAETVNAMMLCRMLTTASTNLTVTSTMRIEGVNKTVGRSSSTHPVGWAPGYHWFALAYDGATAKVFIDEVEWNSTAVTGLVDDVNTFEIYTSGGTSNLSVLDDVRIYDYAIDLAKMAELVGE